MQGMTSTHTSQSLMIADSRHAPAVRNTCGGFRMLSVPVIVVYMVYITPVDALKFL